MEMNDQSLITTGSELSGQLCGRDVIVRTVPEIESGFRRSADFDRNSLFRRMKVEGLLSGGCYLAAVFVYGRALPEYV